MFRNNEQVYNKANQYNGNRQLLNEIFYGGNECERKH